MLRLYPRVALSLAGLGVTCLEAYFRLRYRSGTLHSFTLKPTYLCRRGKSRSLSGSMHNAVTRAATERHPHEDAATLYRATRFVKP